MEIKDYQLLVSSDELMVNSITQGENLWKRQQEERRSHRETNLYPFITIYSFMGPRFQREVLLIPSKGGTPMTTTHLNTVVLRSELSHQEDSWDTLKPYANHSRPYHVSSVWYLRRGGCIVGYSQWCSDNSNLHSIFSKIYYHLHSVDGDGVKGT